jgi:hypothetical protein
MAIERFVEKGLGAGFTFLFFLTYEYLQQARALEYTRPETLASDKHSNLLGLFVTCEENNM